MTRLAGRLAVAVAWSLALASSALSAADSNASPYPQFGSLGPDDLVYRQHQEQLALSYSAIQNGKPAPELVFYTYLVGAPVDLFSLAARLNLPYETLASLNRLDRVREFLSGERVIAASMPGIFVAEEPRSDLDFLVSYRGDDSGKIVVCRVGGAERRLRFYPGARFSAEERALFLGLLFRFPLPEGKLTSGFGSRESPISHRLARHDGIDLAAPTGTDVYAARDGVVTASGTDDTLGEYVIVTHEGGWSTVYGHLSARRVRLNDRVESGMIIGNVGSTGRSTGPHLHFEVRNRGEPRDPERLIPRGKR